MHLGNIRPTCGAHVRRLSGANKTADPDAHQFPWKPSDWEPVDPVVADPIPQDIASIFRNPLLKYTEGGDKTSQYHPCKLYFQINSQTFFSGHVIPYLTGNKFSKYLFRSCNSLLQDYFLGSILKKLDENRHLGIFFRSCNTLQESNRYRNIFSVLLFSCSDGIHILSLSCRSASATTGSTSCRSEIKPTSWPMYRAGSEHIDYCRWLQLISRTELIAWSSLTLFLTERPNRYSDPVALRCRATLCRSRFSRIWRGVAGESRYTPWKRL